jgi:hypothetical protein
MTRLRNPRPPITLGAEFVNVDAPEAESVVAATVLGVVAPSVPSITAPVSVLFVSVCVLLAVVMLLGVMIEESVAMLVGVAYRVFMPDYFL